MTVHVSAERVLRHDVVIAPLEDFDPLLSRRGAVVSGAGGGPVSRRDCGRVVCG